MKENNIAINETVITGRKFRRLIDKESHNEIITTGWYKTDRPYKKATPISNKDMHDSINETETTVCAKKIRKRIIPEHNNWEKICLTPYGLYSHH